MMSYKKNLTPILLFSLLMNSYSIAQENKNEPQEQITADSKPNILNNPSDSQTTESNPIADNTQKPLDNKNDISTKETELTKNESNKDDSNKDKVTTENSAKDSTKNEAELKKGISVKSVKDAIDKLFGNSRYNSIMFDNAQLSNIEKAVSANKKNITFIPEGYVITEKNIDLVPEDLKVTEKRISYIHLSSIIFLDKNNWAIWINGEKIISKNNKEKNPIYVKQIDDHHVKLVWRLGLSKWKILSGSKDTPAIDAQNEVVTEVELKPNQVFNLTNNKITEGISSAVTEAPTPTSDTPEEELNGTSPKTSKTNDNDIKSEIENKIKDLK